MMTSDGLRPSWRRALKVCAGALLGATACCLEAGAQQSAEGGRWAIATGHPDATAAGARVLRDGGNVVDAAVAASLTLGVAEPYGSGLGGKLVLLYHDAATGEVSCIEALCPAAQDIDPEEFAALPRDARQRGWRSVCVPGYPAGLYAAHQRWGSRAWSGLVRPAIDLAERGVEVSEKMHQLFSPHEKQLASDPEAGRLYLVDGKIPDPGASLANQDLADTLRRMAEHGADGFYRGETAERIVAAAQAAGAPMTLDDFANFEPRFTEPLAVNYRGYRVYCSPPPLTGGATVLSVLKAQEETDWPATKPRDADYIDRLSRYLLCLYPEISRKVGDTPAAADETRELFDEQAISSVRSRAERLDPTNPYAVPVVSTGPHGEALLDDLDEASTTHLVVVDAAGNMVSLTQSLSLHFGASVIAPGTGVLMNDSMSNFGTRSKGSVNYLEGGKRPRSTVAPTLVTRDGLPVLALGIPGGQRIPTTTIQLLVDVLDSRTPLDEAFDRPRFHLRRPITRRNAPNHIDLEAGADAALCGELEALGWKVTERPRDGGYFGGGNAAMYLPGNRLIAVGDTRRTNLGAAE